MLEPISLCIHGILIQINIFIYIYVLQLYCGFNETIFENPSIIINGHLISFSIMNFDEERCHTLGIILQMTSFCIKFGEEKLAVMVILFIMLGWVFSRETAFIEFNACLAVENGCWDFVYFWGHTCGKLAFYKCSRQVHFHDLYRMVNFSPNASPLCHLCSGVQPSSF